MNSEWSNLGAARAKPNLFELCRVATRFYEVKSAVFYAMRAGTRKGVKKGENLMGVDGNNGN